MDHRHQSQPRHRTRQRLSKSAGRGRDGVRGFSEGAYHGGRRTTPLMKIRPAEARDRDRIHEILVATARFTEEEVRCAMELVDEAQEQPEKGDYIVHVLDEPESGPRKMVQGYV